MRISLTGTLLALAPCWLFNPALAGPGLGDSPPGDEIRCQEPRLALKTNKNEHILW